VLRIFEMKWNVRAILYFEIKACILFFCIWFIRYMTAHPHPPRLLSMHWRLPRQCLLHYGGSAKWVSYLLYVWHRTREVEIYMQCITWMMILWSYSLLSHQLSTCLWRRYIFMHLRCFSEWLHGVCSGWLLSKTSDVGFQVLLCLCG